MKETYISKKYGEQEVMKPDVKKVVEPHPIAVALDARKALRKLAEKVVFHR